MARMPGFRRMKRWAILTLALSSAGSAVAQSGTTTAGQFLSRTQMTLVSQSAVGDKYSYTYSLAFPTKTIGSVVVSVQVNQHYTPTPRDRKTASASFRIYGLTSKSSTQSSGNITTLRFFVPYSSLPAEVQRKLKGAGQPSALMSNRARFVTAGYPVRGQENEGDSSSGESLGAWLDFLVTSPAGEALAEKGEETLNELLGAEGNGTGGALTGLLSLGMDLNKLLSMNNEDANLLALMLLYLDCGQNPSIFSPIASPDSAQLVSQAQSILSATQNDIGAQFVNEIGGKLAGSITVAESPLADILGSTGAAGGFEWMGQQFTQLIQQDLQQMQQLFPLCRGSWYGTFQVTTTISDGLRTWTYSDAGSFHLATQLGRNLKGTVSGHGNLTVSAPLPGSGSFTYTGTIYGETQKGLQSWGQPAGANTNLNAILSTGPVHPSEFNVTWAPPAGLVELHLDDTTHGTMQTPSYGNMTVQLGDGAVTSGDVPNPGSPLYHQVAIPQNHYTFTVHQLK